jgi:hypothetical protein
MALEQVSLSVNDVPIHLDGFVRKFIIEVMTGIVATLKGTGEIQNLKFSISGEAIKINLNGAIISVIPFVGEFIRNTVIGMVSPLNGVDRKMNRLEINITKQKTIDC